VTVLLLESLAVIVRSSPTPAVGVVVAALRAKWSAVAAVTGTVLVALVAVQLRHFAVTL
jgi:hypothetical protein